jgi:hypothetical protein
MLLSTMKNFSPGFMAKLPRNIEAFRILTIKTTVNVVFLLGSPTFERKEAITTGINKCPHGGGW